MAMLIYEGSQVELSGECVLGRHRDCGIVLKDGSASRRHSRVFQADGFWWAEDLGSANGTKVNGQRIDGRRGLRNGDAIRIGDAEVQFACAERESAPAAPEAAAAAKPGLDPQSLAGRTIAGYELRRLIGRSGMGFLYEAQQLNLQRKVAFKVFFRRIVEQDPEFPAKFRELVSKSGSLANESFVQLHENGVEDGLVWYSMEFVEGGSLIHLLDREGPFAPDLALLVAERIAAAMAVSHNAGVIHRDLSLRTVMLTPEGKIKIFDLGIAGLLGVARERKPETAWHVAPDAVGASQPADDVYSLGCILHHLLTGRPPFAGPDAESVHKAHSGAEIPSLRTAVPQLPAAADDLFQGMLTKVRDWRIADMAEVAKRLRAVREGLADGAQADGKARRMVARSVAADRARERSALKLVIGLSVVGLLVLIGVLVVLPNLRRAPVADEVRPSGAPPVEQVRRNAPVGPVATADPNLAEVRELRARLGEGPERGWARIEADAAALGARLPAGSPAAAELGLLRQQVAADATQWYQREVAKLPAGAGAVGARLAGLSRLRDLAGERERPDADARFQEELAVLVQRLNESRRQARRALESGRAAELPSIAAALEAEFRATPVAGLQRQFATLCQEAAAVAARWNRDWRTTSIAFDEWRGDAALAAGAALLIVGDPARAKRILLADQALAAGPLLRRREGLITGLAAILAFDDPADMQYLDVLSGEPVVAGGALAGKSDDPSALSCTVPVGGAAWSAEFELRLAAAAGELIASCVADGQTGLMLRLSEGSLVVRSAGGETTQAAEVAGLRRLRLAARDGLLRVQLDGRQVAELPASAIVAGSQLRLELAGADWRLESLQVVGGR
jgi:hypothetical protein